ncbi:Ankyrin repeat protein 2 [Giardia duodenalis]|uniref:Ankyrin repeat protein 2 n=1 Tax=Giardia intestinalis (strain ATCC 50803 / WB clone C6) TaxID=184922 RepID=A8B6D9_GIAIC|nr:Ankyrin repeat protein 2 [Giardia intestinalis]KAE8304983.1 Ankyrin repeat protein 2 [Giardia intestinalis]|eukprot:XP_001709449.1 Protein 21.1 [Giardia lamblia ATCC 50803]
MQGRCAASAHKSSSSRAKTTEPTALMYAVREGRIDTVRFLAEKESGYLDEKGDTALIIAACSGNYDAVSILAPLEAGIRGSGRQTALMHLSSLGCPPHLLKLLIHVEAGLTDNMGWTALMFAALWGHVETISCLADLEAGMQDQDGMTALMHATSKRRHAAVEYLLTHCKEKEVGRQNSLGRTALMIAATLEGPESYTIVQALAPQEARMKDQNGMTALMLAIRCNIESNTEILVYLAQLEAGIQDKDGMTALMHACLRGNGTALEVLARSEIGILDRRGYCALNYCIENYKVTFYPYLVSELDVISRLNPYKQLFSRRTLLIDLVFLSSHYKIANLIKRWLHVIVVKLSDVVHFDTTVEPAILDFSIYALIELLLNYYIDSAPITINDLLRSYDELLDTVLEAHLHTVCSVCLDCFASVIHLPCRHMAMCSKCHEQNEQLRGKCVICKSIVKDSIVLSLHRCE